jgi:hypothetical protein
VINIAEGEPVGVGSRIGPGPGQRRPPQYAATNRPGSPTQWPSAWATALSFWSRPVGLVGVTIPALRDFVRSRVPVSAESTMAPVSLAPLRAASASA